MPENLIDNQKWFHMELSLQHLLRYRAEDNFLDRIVTGNESSCHHYQLERKRQSQQFKHSSSPRPKKSSMMQSKWNIIPTFFRYERSASHWIHMLWSNDKRSSLLQYPGTFAWSNQSQAARHVVLWSDFFHDNAWSHAATRTQSMLSPFRWSVLEHPPHSPDHSPCDFYFFGQLKKALKRRRFLSDSNVMDTVRHWLQSQPNSFYERDFHHLVEQWGKWLCNFGDYFWK